VSEVLTMTGVAAVAFVSTSLDNLFLLMGLLSGSRMRTRDVAIAYASSLALVLGVGVAASYAVDFTPDSWLRYLGFIPLGMGLWRIRGFATGAPDRGDPAPRTSTGMPSVFGVTLANSGDSLGVFSSLMAESTDTLVMVIFVTALVMAAVWAALARWLCDHPAVAPRLRKIDRYAVPILLIAIGLYILSDTPTDTV
jgi:cadmium resistance protein CadD (predicted permease)